MLDDEAMRAPLSQVDSLEVVANTRGHRTVLFRAPGSSGLYRIPNIKSRSYRLIEPPPT